MTKKIEIRGVDGISARDVAKAMKAKKLYLAVGSRWNTLAGGYVEQVFQVSTSRIRAYRPRSVDFYSPGYGPVESPLTRAIFFNANRDGINMPGSTFLTDQRVQEVADKLLDLPAPELGEPMAIFVWHRKSGILARCGRS